MLQWLRKQGCPWYSKTCCEAAGGGHLEVVKWAHDNGCPWDFRTCTSAARMGWLNSCSGRGSSHRFRCSYFPGPVRYPELHQR